MEVYAQKHQKEVYSSACRMLGITDETLLIFSTQTEQKYTL